ncbi:polysaccharide deacetylase, partial [Dimargaris cristalligena]
MTFDDGPEPNVTPQVSQALADAGLRATFFALGYKVAQYPELTRAICKAGHDMGIHTWDHPDLATLDSAGIRDQLQRTSDAIVAAGCPTPRLMRFPFGSYSDTALAVAAELDLQPIQWSDDSNDWRYAVDIGDGSAASAEVEKDLDNIIKAIDPQSRGAIVLQHDTYYSSIGTLQKQIDLAQDRGLDIVPVSQCV